MDSDGMDASLADGGIDEEKIRMYPGPACFAADLFVWA